MSLHLDGPAGPVITKRSTEATEVLPGKGLNPRKTKRGRTILGPISTRKSDISTRTTGSDDTVEYSPLSSPRSSKPSLLPEWETFKQTYEGFRDDVVFLQTVSREAADVWRKGQIETFLTKYECLEDYQSIKKKTFDVDTFASDATNFIFKLTSKIFDLDPPLGSLQEDIEFGDNLMAYGTVTYIPQYMSQKRALANTHAWATTGILKRLLRSVAGGAAYVAAGAGGYISASMQGASVAVAGKVADRVLPQVTEVARDGAILALDKTLQYAAGDVTQIPIGENMPNDALFEGALSDGLRGTPSEWAKKSVWGAQAGIFTAQGTATLMATGLGAYLAGAAGALATGTGALATGTLATTGAGALATTGAGAVATTGTGAVGTGAVAVASTVLSVARSVGNYNALVQKFGVPDGLGGFLAPLPGDVVRYQGTFPFVTPRYDTAEDLVSWLNKFTGLENNGMQVLQNHLGLPQETTLGLVAYAKGLDFMQTTMKYPRIGSMVDYSGTRYKGYSIKPQGVILKANNYRGTASIVFEALAPVTEFISAGKENRRVMAKGKFIEYVLRKMQREGEGSITDNIQNALEEAAIQTIVFTNDVVENAARAVPRVTPERVRRIIKNALTVAGGEVIVPHDIRIDWEDTVDMDVYVLAGDKQGDKQWHYPVDQGLMQSVFDWGTSASNSLLGLSQEATDRLLSLKNPGGVPVRKTINEMCKVTKRFSSEEFCAKVSRLIGTIPIDTIKGIQEDKVQDAIVTHQNNPIQPWFRELESSMCQEIMKQYIPYYEKDLQICTKYERQAFIEAITAYVESDSGDYSLEAEAVTETAAQYLQQEVLNRDRMINFFAFVTIFAVNAATQSLIGTPVFFT